MQTQFLFSYLPLILVICAVLYFVISRTRGKNSSAALDEREYQGFKLIRKTDITHNSILFRFGLPDRHVLGLPVGKHILLRFEKDGTPISRPYTPVTSDDDVGFFELLIKIYPNGAMGQYLKSLDIGKTIDVRGPLGQIEYVSPGRFEIKRKPKENPKSYVTNEHKVKTVGMIAGGTGITPMLQIIRQVLKNPKDKTNLSLIFANITEDDILLRKELDTYADKHSDQFKLFYTLDKPPQDWKQGSGYVTTDMISKHLYGPSDDSLILVCGPPPMIKSMVKNLEAFDFREDQYFLY